jgi:hypothetical protein
MTATALTASSQVAGCRSMLRALPAGGGGWWRRGPRRGRRLRPGRRRRGRIPCPDAAGPSSLVTTRRRRSVGRRRGRGRAARAGTRTARPPRPGPATSRGSSSQVPRRQVEQEPAQLPDPGDEPGVLLDHDQPGRLPQGGRRGRWSGRNRGPRRASPRRGRRGPERVQGLLHLPEVVLALPGRDLAAGDADLDGGVFPGVASTCVRSTARSSTTATRVAPSRAYRGCDVRLEAFRGGVRRGAVDLQFRHWVQSPIGPMPRGGVKGGCGRCCSSSRTISRTPCRPHTSGPGSAGTGRAGGRRRRGHRPRRARRAWVSRRALRRRHVGHRGMVRA